MVIDIGTNSGASALNDLGEMRKIVFLFSNGGRPREEVVARTQDSSRSFKEGPPPLPPPEGGGSFLEEALELMVPGFLNLTRRKVLVGRRNHVWGEGTNADSA